MSIADLHMRDHVAGLTLTCNLCKVYNFPFIIAFCKSHPDHHLIISTTHKKEFNSEEKEIITRMFPDNEIGWQMKSIPNHAHCHIIPKKKND